MSSVEGGLALFKSYAEGLHRGRSCAVSHNSTLNQRMVWFAAICGYVMLNGRDQWEQLRGGTLAPDGFLVLALPWAATAVGSVLTHLFMTELDIADAKFYFAKIAAIEVFAIRFSDGKTDLEAFDAILNNRDPGLAALAEGTNAWQKWVTRTERSTAVLLAVSFLWAIVGPFVL